MLTGVWGGGSGEPGAQAESLPMTRISRISRHKLAAVAALAALLGGGALAAVTALGEGTAKKPAIVRLAGRRMAARDLAAAAGYLGISEEQLRSALESGQSLAQVANSTAGKSAAGLIEALVAEKKRRLDAMAASLTKRVTAEVNRSGGPRRGLARAGRHPGILGRRSLALVAAGYLGLSPAQVRSELRAGRTLAQIADATSGKSAAGLMQALIQARREALDAAVASGVIAHAKADRLKATLPQRIAKAVNRQLRSR
jgi:hypothetical protein